VVALARYGKAAGAAGLLIGLFVPVIGVMAGIGLVLYFAGAVITVVRARWFSHVPYPLLYMARWSLPWRCGSPPKHPAPQGSRKRVG
jgi:hypothetical protein